MTGPERESAEIRTRYSFWGRTGVYGPLTFLTLLGRERSIRRSCARLLHLPRGGRVLDVCCGTGRDHPYLVEEVGEEGEVVGLDISPEMLEGARRQAAARGWRKVSLVHGDAASLDLPEKSFDGVVGVLGFSVIPRHEEAMRRCVALLKDDGRIVVCDGAPLRGCGKLFNPFIVPMYRRLACWDDRKDILGIMSGCVSDLEVRWLNWGSIFIASGRRAT